MINDTDICNSFETNLLLFIDREMLPNELKEFSDHIHKCDKCSKILADTIDIIYSGKSNQFDISDEQFETMIAKSVKKKNKAFTFSQDRKEKVIFYWKIGFASILLFASITVSLLSTRTNPVKQVSHELLDWDGAKIETDINSLEKSIDAMNRGDWDAKINQIDNKLDQLERQTDKYSFN